MPRLPQAGSPAAARFAGKRRRPGNWSRPAAPAAPRRQGSAPGRYRAQATPRTATRGDAPPRKAPESRRPQPPSPVHCPTPPCPTVAREQTSKAQPPAPVKSSSKASGAAPSRCAAAVFHRHVAAASMRQEVQCTRPDLTSQRQRSADAKAGKPPSPASVATAAICWHPAPATPDERQPGASPRPRRPRAPARLPEQVILVSAPVARHPIAPRSRTTGRLPAAPN